MSGGSAVITFASSEVATGTSKGVLTVTGNGATITSVVITNTGSATASLSLSSTGAVTLGSVTDAGKFSVFNAPKATLTGTYNFGSINKLVAAAATDAVLSLGNGVSTAVIIPEVTNSSLTDSGSLASVTSKQWLSNDGGYHVLSTPSIGRLAVSGAFGELLNLSDTTTSLSMPW